MEPWTREIPVPVQLPPSAAGTTTRYRAGTRGGSTGAGGPGGAGSSSSGCGLKRTQLIQRFLRGGLLQGPAYFVRAAVPRLFELAETRIGPDRQELRAGPIG